MSHIYTIFIEFCVLQAIAIVDLPDSNGENAVAELEKEFGTDHVIFLAGNVANVEEITGIVSIDCNSKIHIVTSITFT